MLTYPSITAIYTDGACSGNPGPGGWGVRVEFSDGQVHELGGGDRQTTNNRMEMQAAIAALDYFAQHTTLQNGSAKMTTPIPLHTDSEYVIKGITQWIKGWKRKGWKTAAGKPVLNQDLWEDLDRLNSKIIAWQYVRGHAGIPGNERCDAIARSFAANRPISLQALSIPSARSEFSPPLEFSDVQHSSSDANPVELTPFSENPVDLHSGPAMDALQTPSHDIPSELSRDMRVAQVRCQVEMLRMADEIASKGYLISSSELADLMDVNASAVTSRGEQWVWRNWLVSRVRREGNQILWQLERVDQ